MYKILLPFDGSESALHAANYVIARAAMHKEPMEIVLLNVQPPAQARHPADNAEEQLREEGHKLLAPVRKLLEAAGVKHQRHVETGDPVQLIEHYARIYHCDEIVMGTRGKTSILGFVIGSVSTKVLHVAPVPVVLVK